MKPFSLKFRDSKMESEYIKLRQEAVFKTHMTTVCFLWVFLAASGIPELTKGDPLGFFIALGTSGALLLVALAARFSRLMMKYASLLTFFIMLAYNYLRLFFFSITFNNLSTGSLYFRGYSFASLGIVLLIRFFEFKHKVFGLLGGFVLRFCIIGLMFDSSIYKAELIIRHLAIDFFILYTFYSQERDEREVFHRFYQYRDSLSKFKELLTEYLPQSVTVINNKVTKSLFANKVFLETFEEFSRNNNAETIRMLQLSEETRSIKFPIDYLKIDGSSVRELGSSKPYLNHKRDETVNLLQVLENFAALDGSGCPGLTFSASCEIQTASHKLFEVIIKKIKWDNEEAIAIIFTDITYQEKLIALKVADAQKGKILATISHELKTPLGSIFGLIDLCEKKAKDTELVESLKLCKNNAILLLSIVDSLVDLQQMDDGDLKVSPSVVKVKETLENVMQLFSFQAQKNNISLRLKIDKNVPGCIYTDQKKLEQIMINLLGNALKFTFEGSIIIKVTQCQEDEDHIEISVIDTGVGIAEEEKERLFNIYGKLEDREAVNKNGVGLGLTVVKALGLALSDKKRLKGQQAITVESKVGEGSTFSVRILKRLKEEVSEDFDEWPVKNSMRSLIHLRKLSSDSALLENHEEMIPSTLETKIASHTFKSRGLTTISHGDETARKPSQFLETRTEFSLQKKGTSLKTTESPVHKASMNSDLSPLHQVMKRKTGLSSAQLPRFKSEFVLSTEQVLIVDDNPFNLLVAENQLKEIGYSTKSARSGAEAIEIMKNAWKEKRIFKVILMDCQMPVMDGFETTKILKDLMKNNEIQKVAIFALTANTSDRDAERCFECGMDDFLAKPLLIEKLKKALRMIIPIS